MNDNLKWLKRAALFEGTSLIVLIFIGLPLKYWLDLPIAVKIIGPVHGVLFLLFLITLFSHRAKNRISASTTAIGTLASFIPFGTFIFKAKML
jgi:integral membrane protein